jgi:hypothetical protein
MFCTDSVMDFGVAASTASGKAASKAISSLRMSVSFQ